MTLHAISSGMARGGQIVLGSAVRYRFTGKGPFPIAEHRLGVVTNRLRKSMRVTPPQIKEGENAVTMSFGSDVKYFALHEFGFKGKVQVRGHNRRSVARGATTAKGKVTKGEINKRKVSILVKARNNYSVVKPHSRNLTIAARAPMSTELQAERTRKVFLVEINREMNLILNGPGGGQ